MTPKAVIMKSTVAMLLVAVISASNTVAQKDRQGRYVWTASETQSEFGRTNKNLRARTRDLRVLLESPMSLSMSMPEPDLQQLEFDLDLSMSMSMSMP